MPPSRKNWNRAFSLLLILPYSLVAASPSKPHDLSPVLAGRDVDTAASTFNSQLNQDGSVTGSLIAELFPTGETTSNENPENTLLGYGDGNPQEKLISADPSEISRCGQNLEGVNQVPSGKRWFRRQKNDFCQPDAFQTKPGAVEQKTPVKDQIPVQSPDQGEQSPGLGWEPFLQLGKPQNGATNEGKCPSLDYQVAVCFAPWRSSVIPPVALLGGLMGLLDPVSLGSMLTLIISCGTRRREPKRILLVTAGGIVHMTL